MKKVFVLILCAALAFAPAACTSGNSAITNNTVSDGTAAGSEADSSLTAGDEPVKATDSSRTEQTAQNNEESDQRPSEAGGASVDARITAKERTIKSTDNQSGQRRDLAVSPEIRRVAEDEFEIDMQTKLQFSAKTVDDKTVDSSIFKDYKLTMINVWGTLCKPCIAEMSDIQKLYEEMKEQNVNVIGFIANSEEDRQEKAGEILKAKGVTFMNVLFDDRLSGQISAQVAGYPTTLFADGEGNVIGKQISGAKGKDEYKKEIENRIKELQKQQSPG